MSIYETAVKKPITTALIFVAIAILGFFSWSKLSVELLPQSDTNTIMVVTAYPGASAEDIESNVTKVLENSLNSVPNINLITSIIGGRLCRGTGLKLQRNHRSILTTPTRYVLEIGNAI